MRAFDKKFGPDALTNVPEAPGVYRFFDAAGTVVYVGKAKRLRRRLGQYRCAAARKKHRKMRKVIKTAHNFTWEETSSHLDACLLEIRLIQELRPILNISGTFSALYPYVAVGFVDSRATFAFVTKPDDAAGLAVYGAYRSREATAEAFYSLIRLLAYLGHKERAKARGVHMFRCLPAEAIPLWEQFFAGTSSSALSDLALRLVEHSGARARAAAVQEDLDALKSFWKTEARPLREAIVQTNYSGTYPVPKADRDPLFIAYRMQAG